MRVYMNLYAQGWYHRQGKEGTMAFHPGDLYPDYGAAKADIDTEAPYLGTVGVDIPEGMVEVMFGKGVSLEPYGPGEPIPLRESRKAIKDGTPSHIVGMRPLIPAWPIDVRGTDLPDGSIETSEREAQPLQCLPPQGVAAIGKFYANAENAR